MDPVNPSEDKQMNPGEHSLMLSANKALDTQTADPCGIQRGSTVCPP